ncbi:hypothetical protein PVK06_007796 [Gossypium arboreum]|uniref:REF/SRPP-like protein At3g05500 n=1 Tax=Gossypium arboreum TaxID=29729 RepID=A0ABR0QIA1_GOSAR|nr:hypothetical protein PVK06_007796 [Gossypium arboreum]
MGEKMEKIPLVGESVTKLDRKVPPVIKQVSTEAILAAQKAPDIACSVAFEVHRARVVNTVSGLAKLVYTKYELTTKELYVKYEPKAKQCAILAWRKLNKLSLFPQVASVIIPTTAYCGDKYNETVVSSIENSYLPLVPTKKIAKVFGE